MGGNTRIERVILSVMLLGFSGMTFAQPAFKPVPVPPTASSFPSAANSGVMSAANDAEYVKMARANTAMNAAERSGFGKLMSRIFTKRALAAGLRGTPKTIAVGLALDAVMSYFLSEEESASPSVSPVVNQRTWGISAMDKGVLAPSDISTNIDFIFGEKNAWGTNVLKTHDGAYVYGSDGVFYPASLSSKPYPVVLPDKVEPFVFTPKTYDVSSFSVPLGVHVSDSYDDSRKYKFLMSDADKRIFGDDLSDVVATFFYYQIKYGKGVSYEVDPYTISSFTTLEYFTSGEANHSISGYPAYPAVNISYKHKPFKAPYSDSMIGESFYTSPKADLSRDFAFKISPKILNDDTAVKFESDNNELSPEVVQKLANNTLMRVASSAGYQGIPFSTSSPITVEEIQDASRESSIPLTKGMLYQKVNYQPFNETEIPTTSAPILNPSQRPDDIHQGYNPSSYPSFSPGAQSASQIDTSHPGIGEPSLDNPPDGKQILAPLLTLFPFVKNFTLPVRSVQCPVAEFDAFEKHYVIDSHCALLEKNRALFALIAGVVWAFLSLRIILSA